MAAPRMKFSASLDMVNVPPPLRVTLGALITNSVTASVEPAEFIEIVPALV